MHYGFSRSVVSFRISCALLVSQVPGKLHRAAVDEFAQHGAAHQITIRGGPTADPAVQHPPVVHDQFGVLHVDRALVLVAVHEHNELGECLVLFRQYVEGQRERHPDHLVVLHSGDVVEDGMLPPND